ncbi:MAG: SDR family NAD(P)-dependent oxidoreductase [Anaerolineaceae bacterium]|nr:SDR family NAD(P)-dependent oxidoreductase [Anaerolineaceae bacterium]
MNTVLITGASRGIGLATATLLTQQGYSVFGTSRQPQTSSLNGFSLLQLDVRDQDSVQQCVQTVINQTGHIDILINNAGHNISGAVEEASAEDARQLFETNFFGVIRMTSAVLPYMRQAKRGHIINISSLAGIIGVPYLGMYVASKHALEGYSTSLRYELRQFGVHISLIQPGDIRTGIVSVPHSNPVAAYDGIREKVTAIHDSNVNNGPPPEKVARVILRAIRSRNPRLHYLVTTGQEFWVPWMRRLLPDWLTEYFIRNAYDIT